MKTSNHGARTTGAAEARPTPGLTPSAINQANAARRRTGLVRFLERHNLTPTELSRMIGQPSPNNFYNHVSGRSASLASETLERILACFPGETFEQLVGWPVRPVQRAEPGGNQVPLTLDACAGLWRKRPELPAVQQLTVTIPEGLPLPGPDGFAVRVGSPGAEGLYPVGTLLICGPLPAGQGPLPSGTRVIVRRENNRDHTVEITVREVVLDGEHAWLWPRSSHPEHQAPFRTRLPLFGTFPADRRSVATIPGRIIASWRPEPGAAAT
jgi:hypothetical protein